MSEENNELTGHNYDGIEEYDNPLPLWWLITFLATIIFGFLYWIHYEFGGGQNQWQELEQDIAVIEKLKSENPIAEAEEDFQKLFDDTPTRERGQLLYQAKCAVCHGENLQGIIGPNLVDDYWIHGKAKFLDIAQVVRTGVNDKGMPSWESQMNSDEIKAVVIYIVSKKGTTPQNPKPPQGEKIE